MTVIIVHEKHGQSMVFNETIRAFRGHYNNLSYFMTTMTPDMIGYLGYIAATLTTSSFLPQAILTIKTRDTQSLSLSMYSLFTLGVFCWLLYGLYIADKAIILANIITFILAASILVFKIYNVLTHKE